MSTDERLGIELNLDLTKIKAQVQEAQKMIKDAFGTIDFSKLTAGIKQELGGSKNLLTEYANQTGQAFDGSKESIKDLRAQIKELKNEIKARGLASKFLNLQDDITELEKFNKKIKETQDKIKELQQARYDKNARMSVGAHKEMNAYFTDRAVLTGNASAWSPQISLAKIKEEADKFWKATTDANKESASRFKRELSEIVKDSSITEVITNQQRAWNNALGTSGVKYRAYDNGFVRDSAAKLAGSESMANIQSAAIKYNETLKAQSETMLNLNGKQISLNNAVKEYSDWLTGLGKQGKGLWKDKVVSLSEYNKELGKTNGNTKNLFGNMLQLAGLEARFYGVRTILFSVSSQLKEAVTSVLDFNQAIHDTAAISGASLDSMKSMEDVALGLATSSRFTTSQIMETIKTLAQAGVKDSDIPKVAQSSVLFATGAGATSDQAVKLMTTSMNVFDLKAQDTGRIANALTAALNASKLEAGGLATSFNYLANTAGQAGMSLESTLGIVAAMSQVISRDSTIGTGMSQVIAQMMAPRGKFKDLLENNKIKAADIDPSKNEFADVIAKFEKANVTAKEIYSSGLTMNVARSLVAALNVGSQGFREMTEAVTGTDAALIANYKVMDGARAKINILKQEWVASINEIGKSTSFLANAGLEGLRNLAIGVGTTGGQIAVSSTVIVAGISAIGFAVIKLVEAVKTAGSVLSLLASTNVWVAGITVGLTAVAGVIAYLGREQKLQKEANEAFIRGVAETAGKIQGAVTGLIELRQALKSVEKDKNGKLLLTDELKLSIIKLINEYPNYLSELDKERIMHGKINDLIKEKKKLLGQASDQASNAYNYLETFRVDNATKFKSTSAYNTAVQTGKKYGVFDNEGNPFDFVNKVSAVLEKSGNVLERSVFNSLVKGSEYLTYNNNLVARQKSYEPAITHSIRSAGTLRNGVMSYLYETPDILKPDSKPEKEIPPSKAEVRKAEAMDKRLGEITTKNKLALAKARLEEKQLQLEDAKASISDYEETEEGKLKAKAIIDEKLAIKLYELKLEANSKAASAVQGKVTYNESGDPVSVLSGMHEGKSIFSLDEVKRQVTAAQEWLDQMIKNAKLEANNAKAKIDKTEPQLPKLSLTSDYIEKSENRRLSVLKQTAKLQEDMATTADQVKKIEIETLAAEIESSRLKANSFSDEKAKIELWLEENKGKQTEKNKETFERYKARHDELIEKLQTENLLIKAQENEYRKLANLDPWYNFKRGVTDAVRDFGTFSDNVRSFGRSITNKGAEGITNVIDTTLSTFTFPDREKIGELKQQIADLENQKSITEQKINAIAGKTFKTANDVIERQKLQQDLDKVNREISKQKDILDQQTNAWSRFKTSLGNILNDIAKEIQKFLISQAVQGLLKFVVSMFGGGAGSFGVKASDANTGGTGFSTPDFGVGSYNGPVLSKADGGPIPSNLGIPGKDSIPAMVMPEEYMIKAQAHRYYGTDFLHAVNNMQLRKFANGGSGGANLKGIGSGSSSGGEQNLVIYNFIDPTKLPPSRTNATEVLNIIALDALAEGPTFKTVKRRLQGN